MAEISITPRMSVADAKAVINSPDPAQLTRREMVILYGKARTPADKKVLLAKYPELNNIFSEVNHRDALAPAAGTPDAARLGATGPLPDGTVTP